MFSFGEPDPGMISTTVITILRSVSRHVKHIIYSNTLLNVAPFNADLVLRGIIGIPENRTLY